MHLRLVTAFFASLALRLVQAQSSSNWTIDLPLQQDVDNSIFTYPSAQATGDVCVLAQLIGTGPYRIPRWYFNPATRRCELFYYSGCCGNGNNFPTFQTCQVLCEVDPCTQQRDPGVGSLQQTRYFFNAATKLCQEFTYFGSGGNRNNFQTADSCRAQCPESPDVCAFGQPAASGADFIQCGFNNVVTNTCPSTYFCHVGATLRTTLCCPKGTGDRCVQPLRVGTGGQQLSRWYFDPVSERCRSFDYAGLQGNENNFLTRADCDNACFVNPCAQGRPLQSDSAGGVVRCGPTNTNICVQFGSTHYCHVGDSPRTTVCCPTLGGARCSQALALGRGRASLSRWYLEPSTRRCQPFSYTGLGGNENNFGSLDECRRLCRVFDNVCALGEPLLEASGLPQQCTADDNCPADRWCHFGADADTTVCCPGRSSQPCSLPARQRGSGAASLQRWTYDQQTRRCVPFTYSGQMGNQNNFRTRQQCTDQCPEYENPCVDGNPVVPPTGSRPIQCAPTDANSCPPGTWCHPGVAGDTTFCCPGRSTDACSQPQAVGSGQVQLSRWYFDSISRACRSFVYRGLRGNQNNFIDRRSCESACPVFENPCLAGQPARDAQNRLAVCDALTTCTSGYYCHIGFDSDSTVCCPSLGDACQLLQAPGQGSGRPQQRYYFDAASRQCLPFQYRGTKGNDNNFGTQRQCATRCPVFVNPCPQQSISGSQGSLQFSCAQSRFCPAGFWCHLGATTDTTVCCLDGDARCSSPVATGEGDSSLRRFYYEQSTRRCLQFTYRGLRGNANNFDTVEDCERACPTWVNPCPSGEPTLGADGQPQECRPNAPCARSRWCHLGAPGADTTVCCPNPGDPCNSPLAPGTGPAALRRWQYNAITRTCSQFTYRGLQGNTNNFLSQTDCESTCPVWLNACVSGQPLLDATNKPLLCSALGSSVCPTTHWCHVGAEPATTMCCPGRADAACNQARSVGLGTDSLPRWSFDLTTRQCAQFSYRGLNGNQNNFVSRSACESACPVFVNPCPSTGGFPPASSTQLARCSAANVDSCALNNQWCHIGASADTTVCCPNAGFACDARLQRGSGDNSLPRFYFDAVARRCLPFTYGGLGGNQNNFLTRTQCENTCPGYTNPCLDGEPFLVARRPQVCAQTQPCPSGYWCHVGAPAAATTVCCRRRGVGDPCEQPLLQGTGNAALRRWYFSPATRTCQSFSYGGLRGSQNNFLSQSDCERACDVFDNPCAAGQPETDAAGRPVRCSPGGASICAASFWCHSGADADSTVCCPGRVNRPCTLAVARGTGVASVTRWYYDSQSAQCRSFSYSGAGGNQNNFQTQQACRTGCNVFTNACPGGRPVLQGERPLRCSSLLPTSCGPANWCHVGESDATTMCCPNAASEPCNLPLARGSGQSTLSRWYFDRLARRCAQFTYRGLFGNQNNYLTQSACEAQCNTFENPCADGPPAQDTSGGPRFCNQGNPSCPNSYWCHFGANADTTVCCPQLGSAEACTLPLATGRGAFALDRWYYDANSRSCRRFSYAGTLGNRNNFFTETDCTNACPVYENVCASGQPLLGADSRPLNCGFASSSCASGYWCHVGGSPSRTMCCPGSRSDACAGVASERGEGNEFLPRWYYDAAGRQCRSFTYAGQKGNANNFVTRQDCEATCDVWQNPCVLPVASATFCSVSTDCSAGQWCHQGGSPDSTVCCPGAVGDPCSLPQSSGDGNEFLLRFYYDSTTRQCLRFSYRGSKGNQNNFSTREDCEARCRVRDNPCAQGDPYTPPGGSDPQSCNPLTGASTCPTNYWCHAGASIETTVCCPGAASAVCTLPQTSGTGGLNLQRWFYNGRTCERFNYGGLRGNQNNFVSQEACRRSCREIDNPCIGQPATNPSGQVVFCSASNTANCPINFWCHLGATPETTVCCPGATNPCSVPLAPGTGISRLDRWYYNADNRQCVSFVYNGRRGNQNNFLSQADCESTCPVLRACAAGDAEMDAQGRPRVCSPFVPLSCAFGYFCLPGDVARNEPSYCCPASAADRCSASRVHGDGDRRLARWHFDPATRSCQQFSYRGARGNENNFLSQRDCEDQCRPESNPCASGSEPLRELGKVVQCGDRGVVCPSTHFCHVGESADSTLCCPSTGGDGCELPRVAGRGRASLPRWYHNAADGACLPFTYAGEGGNENNYQSRSLCEQACPVYRGFCPHGRPLLAGGEAQSCGVGSACPPDYVCHVTVVATRSVCCFDPAYFCLLPRDPGPCDEFSTRYGYNRDTGTCTPFRFGGCSGNLNNFVSLQTCTDICCDKGYQ